MKSTNHKQFTKFFLSIGIWSLVLLNIPKAIAQTATPSPISQNIDLNKQIDDLKNKVASKVAQLKLVEKRGTVGIVVRVTNNQITIMDLSGGNRIVDVDEFTKFTSASQKTTFGISDINKGMRLGVLGLYNKESRRILSRFISEMNVPEVITGVVALKDSDNFNITVATGKELRKISVENISKVFIVGEDGKLLRGGFSKIEKGNNVIVTGFPDPKNKDITTAGRVFVFQNIPGNPSIDISVGQALSPATSITPSTGSGRKLTPIVK